MSGGIYIQLTTRMLKIFVGLGLKENL